MVESEPGGTGAAGEDARVLRIAKVLLPLPLPEAFDYAEPERVSLNIGDHVAVPLGPRLIRGVVVELRDGAGGNRPLKAIEARLEDPPLPPRAVEFVQWAARYAVDFPGRPLAMAIRGLGAKRPAPKRRLIATAEKRRGPARNAGPRAGAGGGQRGHDRPPTWPARRGFRPAS